MNNNCPCCSTSMLRHVRYSKVYWYCPNCKQEMPNLADWVELNTILNSFRTHSCQMPMKLSDKGSDLHQYQGGTVQNLLGIG